MRDVVTRRIARSAWKETLRFDAVFFFLRYARARVVASTYSFDESGSQREQAFFCVEGGQAPYHVFLDLTGEGAHFCTCPDGARRVVTPAGSGSLCKHVLGAMIHSNRQEFLLPYICMGTKRPGWRP